jgi:hypothetical protein
VCCTFDELILPTTMVSLSCLKLVSSILWSSREVPFIFALLGADRRVVGSEPSRAVCELCTERTQLEMQLIIAQVAAAAAVASKASAPVVWTSLGPLPQWVLGLTTRWAPGTTRLALHGTRCREAQGLQRRSTRLGNCTCPALYKRLLDVLD